MHIQNLKAINSKLDDEADADPSTDEKAKIPGTAPKPASTDTPESLKELNSQKNELGAPLTEAAALHVQNGSEL